MKKLLFTLSFLTSFVAFGQKMPSDYFTEASKFFEEENFDKAIECYQYIVDNHPNNELYSKSFYNIGYINFTQNNYDKAIDVFKTILKSNFNEKESLGGDIMADPYTNYRNRASKILSDIYYNKNMFDSALYYLNLSDKVYPYLHFCGNESADNDIYMALRYADIYQKLNQPNKAIEKLLPTIFNNVFADNSKAIAELKQLLAKKKGVKQKFDKSLEKIYSKTIQREDYSYKRYYFKFMNVEIDVPNSYENEEKKFDKDNAIKEIRHSEFYKMIEQL